MGTDLSTAAGSREAGLTHDLISFASSRHWSLATAVERAQGEDVAAMVASAEWWLRPLKDVEAVKRDHEGKWQGQCKASRDWLKPFGMMIAPGLAADARTNWLNALLVSLSDIPADIIQEAAQQAMHKPMTFLNEVHGAVRAIAETMLARRRLALARLHDLQAEIRRSGDTGNQLPPPPDELTFEDMRRMSPEMRKIGLGCGAITQEQLDEADGLGSPEQSKAA